MNNELRYRLNKADRIENIVWIVYVVLITTFTTVNGVQTIAPLLVVGYSLCSNRQTFFVTNRRNNFFIWYFLFFVYCSCSIFWAYYPQSFGNGETLNVMLRIIPVLYCAQKFCEKGQDRTLNLAYDFCVGVCIFCVYCIITTPVSDYLTTRFAIHTGQWRNYTATIALAACVISFYLAQIVQKKRMLVIAIVCAITVVLTGSRKSLLALFLGICLIIILENNAKRKIKWIAMIILTIVVLLLINDYFQLIVFDETYFERILAIFDNKYDDGGSASDRSMLRSYAMQMFYQKPIFGWGVNNFRYYMGAINSRWQTYSHCNFTELLANVGVFGFILYYSGYIQIIKNVFSNLKNSIPAKMAFVGIVIFAIQDYGNVSYPVYAYVLYISIMYAIAVWVKFEDEERER